MIKWYADKVWLFIETPIIMNIRTMVWRFKSAFIEKFIWDLSPVSLDFFFFLNSFCKASVPGNINWGALGRKYWRSSYKAVMMFKKPVVNGFKDLKVDIFSSN